MAVRGEQGTVDAGRAAAGVAGRASIRLGSGPSSSRSGGRPADLGAGGSGADHCSPSIAGSRCPADDLAAKGRASGGVRGAAVGVGGGVLVVAGDVHDATGRPAAQAPVSYARTSGGWDLPLPAGDGKRRRAARGTRTSGDTTRGYRGDGDGRQPS